MDKSVEFGAGGSVVANYRGSEIAGITALTYVDEFEMEPGYTS
jgi:hypothetical protein